MNNRRPLYEDIIVAKAREAGLAGATVLRGPMGFGLHAKVHTAKILDLSAKLPLVIEIVDSEEKIRAFLLELDAMKTLGLVTTREGRGAPLWRRRLAARRPSGSLRQAQCRSSLPK